jgi:hypothetical protein
MCELYAPESGSYVVQDEYTLVKDQKHETPELIIKTSDGQNPELENASFKVIKTYIFDDSPDNKAKTELLRVFIEGDFSAILDPKETIGPASYSKGDPDPEKAYTIPYEKFTLRQLSDFSLPCVAIKGTFAHTKNGRYYDVEIHNALLMQDFPAALFGRPVSGLEYSFVSTDVNITPVIPRTSIDIQF